MKIEVDDDLAEMIKRIQEHRRTDRVLDRAIKEKQEDTFFDWLKHTCSDIWNLIVKVAEGVTEFFTGIFDLVESIFF